MSSSPGYRSLAQQTERYGPALAAFLQRYLETWTPYRPGRWVYEDGLVWKAALDLSAASGLRFPADFAYREISARIDADGVIAGYAVDEFNIDNINPAQAVHRLWRSTGEARFRRAVEHQFGQLDAHPRTRSGNYWHKQIYPNQVWLDGLYMAQPLRCAWAAEHGDSALLGDVVDQFQVVWQRLRDPDSGLLWHGWDESGQERWAHPETGCSPNVWSRALAWYVMALVDCIDALESFEPAQSQRLAQMLVPTVDALLARRSPRGLWYQLTDLPDQEGNYEETSASLMIAYALMRGTRLGLLGARAGQAGEQALTAIVERHLDEQRLGGICGVAGLGNTPYRDGSVEYYLSEAIVDNDPKGVAALLLATAEALYR